VRSGVENIKILPEEIAKLKKRFLSVGLISVSLAELPTACRARWGLGFFKKARVSPS